ncbi:phosphatase PAP2 family protein [Taibaiella soli]|uniref:phosphatase PAP2 family protein n=1 Tax=Taibaiella soli TaxID=1649169 RepID=UPI0014026171|nr:phosphatase PAP2 family protein [Taibaiella soli]
MRKAPYTSYNLYFIIPFIIWIIFGGCMLLSYDKQTLFAAVNTHYSPIGDVLMYNITHMGEGPFIIIVLLVLIGAASFRNIWYFVAAVMCNAVPALVIQMAKRMAHAPRPLNYFKEASWIHITSDWPKLYQNSFPSGHSAGAFSLFCFLSFLLPERYRAFGLLFFAMAISVCYSRLYVAAHFFADVYAGSVIGCTVTIISFAIMRSLQPRFFSNQDFLTK